MEKNQIIAGILILTVVSVCGCVSYTITLPDSELQYEENNEIPTIDECLDTYFECNETTKITHNFNLKDNQCIDSPILQDNSFDCGYVTPCDLESCKQQDSYECDSTTKIIHSYYCDNKLGCTSQITKEENSIDCEYLFSGKYDLEDITLIRKLAKECKFNIEECALTEYKFNKIYVGKSDLGTVNTITGEITYSKIYIEGYIRTPFVEALIFAANKEKLYDSYTDEEIIYYLSLNQLLIIINPKYENQNIFGAYSSLDEPIGNLKTLVIKYNNQIYKGIDTTNSTYIKVIYDFDKLFDKNVKLTIVGNYREINSTINLNQYK